MGKSSVSRGGVSDELYCHHRCYPHDSGCLPSPPCVVGLENSSIVDTTTFTFGSMVPSITFVHHLSFRSRSVHRLSLRSPILSVYRRRTTSAPAFTPSFVGFVNSTSRHYLRSHHIGFSRERCLRDQCILTNLSPSRSYSLSAILRLVQPFVHGF